MSDVPAMTWWLAALVLVARQSRLRTFVAGLAVSAAVLTRPSLALLAAVVAAFLVVRPRSGGGEASRTDLAACFTLGVAPGAALLAWIQQTLYGSPFSSGYGPLDQLFAWSHIVPNLGRYPTWLMTAHTPLVCLALAAPFVVRARASRPGERDRWRQAAWLCGLCLTFALAVFVSYVAYVPYDDWWYLRFLLPAVPLILTLTALVLVAACSRLPKVMRVPAAVACVVALAAFFVNTAGVRGVFGLPEFERRFRVTGEFVAARLPERAVALAVWESGSVRHYGKRLSIAFDEIEPAWLDRALAFLAEQGRPPYFVLETWEEAAFRARFEAASQYGALDWPPMAQVGNEVRVYNPDDRARYLAGEALTVERVWPSRGERRRR